MWSTSCARKCCQFRMSSVTANAEEWEVLQSNLVELRDTRFPFQVVSDFLFANDDRPRRGWSSDDSEGSDSKWALCHSLSACRAYLCNQEVWCGRWRGSVRESEQSDHWLDRSIASGEIDKTFTMRKWSRSSWTRRTSRHRLRSPLPNWRVQLHDLTLWAVKSRNCTQILVHWHRSISNWTRCVLMKGRLVSQPSWTWNRTLLGSQKTMVIERECYGAFLMQRFAVVQLWPRFDCSRTHCATTKEDVEERVLSHLVTLSRRRVHSSWTHSADLHAKNVMCLRSLARPSIDGGSLPQTPSDVFDIPSKGLKVMVPFLTDTTTIQEKSKKGFHNCVPQEGVCCFGVLVKVWMRWNRRGGPSNVRHGTDGHSARVPRSILCAADRFTQGPPELRWVRRCSKVLLVASPV